MPAAASARPSATAADATSATDQPLDPFGPHELLVLAVLQHRPQRALGGAGVEPLRAEQLERGYPVDRLGDPWRLLHVDRAQPGQRAGDLERERPGAAGHAPSHDLGL